MTISLIRNSEDVLKSIAWNKEIYRLKQAGDAGDAGGEKKAYLNRIALKREIQEDLKPFATEKRTFKTSS